MLKLIIAALLIVGLVGCATGKSIKDDRTQNLDTESYRYNYWLNQWELKGVE